MALIDKLTAIGNAIREKNGSTEPIPLVDMPQSILDIVSGGGTEEIEDLIDNSGVLDSTEDTTTEKVEQLIDRYSLLFINSGNLIIKGNVYKKESIDFYIDLPYLMQMTEFLRDNKYVKRFVGINTSNLTNMNYFLLNSVVEEIERPFDLSSISNASNLSGAFGSSELRKVSFVADTIKKNISFSRCSLLSAESIQSIIDGLATVETAQTLTLNSAISLTDEQKATINAKGWTLVQ